MREPSQASRDELLAEGDKLRRNLVEMEDLIEQLHAHNAELEMQNEQLRRAHELVEESRIRYADLYDLAPVAYLTLDRSGVVLECNLTCAGMLGWNRQAITRKPFGALVRMPASRGFWAHLRECDAIGHAVTELSFTTKSGRALTVEATSVRSTIEGNAFGYRTALIDITERRRAEEDLKRSLAREARLREKLEELERAREEWTAIIAHDLRQPISAITLADETLLRELPIDANSRARSAAERIAQSAMWLTRMIEDLLEVSRLEVHQLNIRKERIDLVDSIQNAVDVVRAPGQEVELCCGMHICPVEVDRCRIEQVLQNLLSNALKYGVRGAPVQVALEQQDDEVEVAITNRGEALDAQELDRIFSRFYRAIEAKEHASGLGVGLYIARGLIEAHGGRIWAESQQGRTTFRFRLPAAARS